MRREVDLKRRAEIGQERRARTRAAIIQAAIEVMAEKGWDDATTQDFMKKAGVSRGTFYNYFDTKKDVFAAIADDLMDTMNEEVLRETRSVQSADERLAWILHRVLCRATEDQNWMHALLFVFWRDAPGFVGETTGDNMRADLELGRSQGVFTLEDDAVAANIIVGSTMMGARFILAGQYSPEQQRLLVRQVLVALGVPQDRATVVSETVYEKCSTQIPVVST